MRIIRQAFKQTGAFIGVDFRSGVIREFTQAVFNYPIQSLKNSICQNG